MIARMTKNVFAAMRMLANNHPVAVLVTRGWRYRHQSSHTHRASAPRHFQTLRSPFRSHFASLFFFFPSTHFDGLFIVLANTGAVAGKTEGAHKALDEISLLTDGCYISSSTCDLNKSMTCSTEIGSYSRRACLITVDVGMPCFIAKPPARVQGKESRKALLARFPYTLVGRPLLISFLVSSIGTHSRTDIASSPRAEQAYTMHLPLIRLPIQNQTGLQIGQHAFDCDLPALPRDLPPDHSYYSALQSARTSSPPTQCPQAWRLPLGPGASTPQLQLRYQANHKEKFTAEQFHSNSRHWSGHQCRNSDACS
ncbi:uncharacterized protein MYCFIDRAFT_172394 [Pseudocercospora fijiensis CIRAD86]|uniref:Uncharacterized protein n=1 Tax=Pseudocercospora fijiensis (strain CIRAD86) TaxID=383855 RepID=M2ZA21_PSEFD|nr:uncharacterized protein MYCFIDRAFT_172394 [Pseudocercospora fijiensis CIRAD86]EME86695.1 hypothetical protein MYCFIDRAFT_172394 [Pseudocercospora fijiensis CIRAD86]